MENFLSNLLNRHRGQIASVRPRPVHRFEDKLSPGHAESQSANKAGWVSAGLDWEKTSRQSSLAGGYQDENEAVGIAQSAIPQVSHSALTPINLDPSIGQPVGSDKNIESGTKSDTYSLITSAARANKSLALKSSSHKEPTLPSAGVDSPTLPDSPSIRPNQRPAPIRSGDRRQPEEMLHRFPKSSVIPEKTLIDSNVSAKGQPISAMHEQSMDYLPKNVSEFRESNLFGSQKTQLAPPNTPVTPSSSPQDRPPALHVTIGRIEVRATSPPQATNGRVRPPKSGPLLSLNDYLNRRSGMNQ